MKRRDVLTMGAALCLSPVILSRAFASAPDPRVADLFKTGKLRVGLAPAPIMATLNAATGVFHGVAVDLASDLAHAIGVDLVQVPYARPGAIMAGLNSDAWDLAFLGIDPARASEAHFSAPYMEVDLTYLVRRESPVQNIADADKEGIRIAVPRGDLVDILQTKMLKHAELVRADTVIGAFELLRTGQADICALPLPNLLQNRSRLPGSRIIDGRFGVNRVGIVVPKGKTEHLAYFSEFLEQAKASGTVQRAIERAGLQGVRVAPPVKENSHR